MTPNEERVAEAAAKAAEGFLASFIPEAAQVAMVGLVVAAADKASLEMSHITQRFYAGKAALVAAIAQSGHAGQVGDATINAVVNAILDAVHGLRKLHVAMTTLIHEGN
jgi:hypothetical protein